MKRILRVRRFGSKTKFTGFQLLQEKRFWGWKTIDREEVPTHVIISLGAVGDAGGWVSKFRDLGSWGRDGIITPKEGAVPSETRSGAGATLKRWWASVRAASSKAACA